MLGIDRVELRKLERGLDLGVSDRAVAALEGFYGVTPGSLGFPGPGPAPAPPPGRPARAAARKAPARGEREFWIGAGELIVRTLIVDPEHVTETFPSVPIHILALGGGKARTAALREGRAGGSVLGREAAARLELPWESAEGADVRSVVHVDPRPPGSWGHRRPGLYRTSGGAPIRTAEDTKNLKGPLRLRPSAWPWGRKPAPSLPGELPRDASVAETYRAAHLEKYLETFVAGVARRALERAEDDPAFAGSGVDAARIAVALEVVARLDAGSGWTEQRAPAVPEQVWWKGQRGGLTPDGFPRAPAPSRGGRTPGRPDNGRPRDPGAGRS